MEIIIKLSRFDSSWKPSINSLYYIVDYTDYFVGTGKSFTQMSNGFNFWGKAGNFGFQLYYRDYTETGTGVRSYRNETPITDIVELTGTALPNRQNFSEIRASINYQFKKGSISIGKDQLLWGYGENGRIVLSDKAPTYPYIRLDYNLLVGCILIIRMHG